MERERTLSKGVGPAARGDTSLGVGLDASLPAVAEPLAPVPAAPDLEVQRIFEVTDPPHGLVYYYIASTAKEALVMHSGNPAEEGQNLEVRDIPDDWRLFTMGQGRESLFLTAAEWARSGAKGFFSESVNIRIPPVQRAPAQGVTPMPVPRCPFPDAPGMYLYGPWGRTEDPHVAIVSKREGVLFMSVVGEAGSTLLSSVSQRHAFWGPFEVEV